MRPDGRRSVARRLIATALCVSIGLVAAGAPAAAAAPSVTPAQTLIAAGNYVSVSWADIASPTGSDWIGLYPAGASDDPALRVRWSYTSGTVSGSLSFVVLPSDTPGSYQFRLFAANGLIRLAASVPVTITAPNVTVTTALTSVAADNYLTVSWSGANTPTGSDWIGIYPAAASDDVAYRVTWVYTGGATSGSVVETILPNVPPGAYEARMFYLNGVTRLGKSAPFTITAPSVSVSVAPTTFGPGATVSVTWTGHVFADGADWIGLYPSGAPDDTAHRISWRYTNGLPSATLPFTVPAGAPPPPYELRLYYRDGLLRLGSTGSVGVATNNPPAVTALPDRTVFQKDGLTDTVTFADPDPNEAFTVALDYGDGATEARALDQAHSFTIRHSYARVGIFTVSIRVTDRAGAVGSTSFHVKVTPKRVMVYVHGTTGSFAQDPGDPAKNDMPSLFGPLAARYGTVQFFRFYEDRGNQDPVARPRCLPNGRRSYPTIDPSAGLPLDSAGADPAPGICDSNDDIELNGVLLDDDVRALASQFDKVTLLSNSGGTRIVRSFLAYAAARAAANPTQFSTLSVVDQVVTLEGVQQGTYIAAAYNGLDPAARLDPRIAFARAVVVAIVTATVGHDPNRPTFEDVTPMSQNIVHTNRTVPIPNGIHYVNVYGNIRVSVSQSFGFFTLRTDTVEIGDVVMLPGEDDPTAVPTLGGARFLPAAAGRGRSSTEWDLAHDFSLDFDPSADASTFGSILAAPELHTNFGKQMHDICVRGGDGGSLHLDDALFRAISALDDGTAPDPTKLGFGIAPRVACVASLGTVSAAPARASAAAAVPRPELVFQDRRSRAVFTVQADASAPDAGHFTLAIPGRGVYSGVAARRARETERDRLHLNVEGQAQLRSGTPARLQAVRVRLEAELDTARHSAEVELHDGNYEFHLNARPASTAGLGPTIAAVESSLTANDPTRFYSLLSATVTGSYSAAAFATAWNDGAATGRITALTRGTVGSVQTTAQGFSYVAVPYTATRTTPSGATSSLAFRMILIDEGNAWKFMTTIRQ